MADDIEKIPLDARLLSYAIIELNISRRNVAIYPTDHPSVKSSLSTTFKFLKQLFEIRSEITLAVAKNTLIIDKYQLDKKNPVFREFALALSQMNIAYVTFKIGLTKDELYRFHRFITEKIDDFTVENLKEVFKNYKLTHVDVNFIDYQKFSIVDCKSGQQTQKVSIWERYIYGLIEGTLQGQEVSDEVREIPPEILARLLNKVSDKNIKEEAYDRVITTYMRNSSENIFSSQDLKRLLEFIERLKPDLKKRFLSSAVKTFSDDTASVYQSFKKISVEDIEGFLDTINKQRIAIPPVLTSLIDKISYKDQDYSESIYLEEDLLEDEEFFPSNLTDLFDESIDEKVDINKDIQEIHSLVDFDATELRASQLMEFESEFNEDLIDKKFNQIILELMLSETQSEAEYQIFVNIVKEQSKQLLWIGQYEQIVELFEIIESNKKQNRFPSLNSKAIQYYHSSEFILQMIDSFKLLGRQMRKAVQEICKYYDKEIIPYLMDALIEEESQIIRRYLMDLLKEFGNKVITEALKRLNDNRWFVRRNMLYILTYLDIPDNEVCNYIRPYCRDENSKVSVAALKCLLKVKDAYAIETIRQHLASKSKELFEQAITLASTFKIKEVVGDLIPLLNKKGITGADILDKIPIVKALGDIGDPQTIDTLRTLVSSKSILFRKIMEQLKEEIYKTLKNYPYESIKDFVEAGKKSKNKVIKEESLHLSKENA